LAAGAVDAMLKSKGLTTGTLFARIEQAACSLQGRVEAVIEAHLDGDSTCLGGSYHCLQFGARSRPRLFDEDMFARFDRRLN